MSIDTSANPIKVVLDTNIIISAIGFGGKPREILKLILDKKLQATTSPVLLAELEDVVTKKFPKLARGFQKADKQIRKKIKIVQPRKAIKILKDEPDNRVLEVAIEDKCNYIITGDRELLKLNSYQNIKILTPNQFLNTIT